MNRRLVQLRPQGRDAEPLARLLHAQLRGVLSAGACPLMPAPDALSSAHYRLGIYTRLGTPAAVRGCADDLASCAGLILLAAVFSGPLGADENVFGEQASKHLEKLSNHYSSRCFQVLKMHPGAIDWAHRFSWPVLLFSARNPLAGGWSEDHERCQRA